MDTDNSNDRKARAARELLARYHHQLLEGCGNPTCTNENCASSPQFTGQFHSSNDSAALALRLFLSKASLCPGVAPVHSTDSGFVDEEGQSGASAEKPSASLAVSPPSPPSTRTPEPMVLGYAEDADLPPLVRDSSDEDFYEPMQLSHSPKGGEAKPLSFARSSAGSFTIYDSYLTEEKLLQTIDECRATENYSALRRLIGEMFCKQESLNLSFRRYSYDIDRMVSYSPPTSSAAGSSTCSRVLRDTELSLDITSVRRSLKALFSVPTTSFASALNNAVKYLCDNVTLDLKYQNAFSKDPDYLNMFFILLEILPYHGLAGEFLEEAFPKICAAINQLPLEAQAKMATLMATTGEYYSAEQLLEYVHCAQQLITMTVLRRTYSRNAPVQMDTTVIAVVQFLRVIYYASLLSGERSKSDSFDVLQQMQKDESAHGIFREKVEVRLKEDPLGEVLKIRAVDVRHPAVNYDEFLNETLSEAIEMDVDYVNYKAQAAGDKLGSSSDDHFSFMLYPFILVPTSKIQGMFYDNRVRMLSERRISIFQALTEGAMHQPYLRLHVNRETVVHDALLQLEIVCLENPGEFRKQLVIEFEGEHGVDEGGVSKEFYQMVMEQLFIPDYGMFVQNKESRLYWFSPQMLGSKDEYTLVGLLFGLAIYNSIIVDVQFPVVLYRKLQGCLGEYEDLADLDPVLYNSLKQVLEYEGDVQEAFMLTFRVSYRDLFNSELTYDLKEGGEAIPVTKENRREFVDLYADFLLNKAVDEQFRAFWRGFHIVTQESPLSWLFRPEEVDVLVCGSRNFDFNELEESTEYDNGYSAETPVIRWFWEIVHEMSMEDKRLLLQFATGSDRIPVGGMSKLHFIIAKNGTDSDSLPTAHTCFNVMLLPEYSSKEKLKERLQKAITYSQGFGLM